MTGRANIRYPLKVRGMKEEIWRGDVEYAAEMVDCRALLDCYPSQLSVGQQRRVALTRGLVARPDLVLFAEPLSNLEARLRGQVRTETHELHERLPLTAMIVTHDQPESRALSGSLPILNAGRSDQHDTPERPFDTPTTDYIAAFIGLSNRLELVY
jgi:iron(III) transport system ATP-binding protein